MDNESSYQDLISGPGVLSKPNVRQPRSRVENERTRGERPGEDSIQVGLIIYVFDLDVSASFKSHRELQNIKSLYSKWPFGQTWPRQSILGR
jgi:hypothetical protein